LWDCALLCPSTIIIIIPPSTIIETHKNPNHIRLEVLQKPPIISPCQHIGCLTLTPTPVLLGPVPAPLFQTPSLLPEVSSYCCCNFSCNHVSAIYLGLKVCLSKLDNFPKYYFLNSHTVYNLL